MKQKIIKFVAVFLAVNLLYEIFFPAVAYALTGGPSQPEVQSFEPLETTEMVDLFSGDFVYNIPLLDVEGYPINISYHSGITMDQEASWTGLGWNINPGAITRNMRGLPDDFSGDDVTKEMYVKPNYTIGIDAGITTKAFGFDFFKFLHASASLSVSEGVFYNSYKGIGFEQKIGGSLGLQTSTTSKPKNLSAIPSASLDFSISDNSQNGMTLSKNLSFSVKMTDNETKTDVNGGGVGVSYGESVNSRSGVKQQQFRASYSVSAKGTYNGLRKDKINQENRSGTASGGGGTGFSSISSSLQTYVPQISMPFNNFNASARFAMGTSWWGIDPEFFINGYVSAQSITDANKVQTKKAYGYLYSQDSKAVGDDVLMDVNREKDGGYTLNNPSLPLANHTYDIYSVAGQGIGGMYRPHRGDVGVLFDSRMKTADGIPGLHINASLGFELGVGALAHDAIDITVSKASSQSGRWNDYNNLASCFNYITSDDSGDPLYEPAYFKTAGEKVPVIEDFIAYQYLGEALSPTLRADGDAYNTDCGHLKMTGSNETGGNDFYFNDNNVRKQRRDKRSQHISFFTASQSNACLQPAIESYPMNTFDGITVSSTSRSSRPLPHISEVSVIKNEGSRYVYGIPAYNNSQQEYAFSDDKTGDLSTGLVEYDPNWIGNKEGPTHDAYDGFYTATKLPAYAHSYLLTAVLSPDYVDVNQNGIDSNDLGSYTKINYTKAHDNYRWRVPYDLNMANYQKGNFSDTYDDKGNIIYGTKEMWYVHSIETKNYVAEFTLRPREDALGVIDMHGGRDTSEKTYYIESISLYTKAEKSLRGANSVPIKTVHFEYDYTLCQGIPNRTDGTTGQKGKLTLRKIYFTYGSSKKGKFSTYEFKYTADDAGAPTYNRPYNIKGYDRWGNFKPNDKTLTNTEFPYVGQIDSTQDYEQEWTLNEIDLPSGGSIHVEYESDDYAYVQNRQAMSMFNIKGFGNTPDYSKMGNQLFTSPKAILSPPYFESGINTYIFIDLPTAVYSDQEFNDKYMSGIQDLYFNCFVGMGKSSDNDNYEYIKGYAQVESSGLVSGNTQKAWIKIKNVGYGNSGANVNPISKATWQFERLNAPSLVYPGSDLKRSPGGSGAAIDLIKMLVGVVGDLDELFININFKLMLKGYGQGTDLSHSWIRINQADKKKLGGGVRVKKLYLSDNWQSMTSGTTSNYGQEYDYTTTEKYGSTTVTISSGVASYEPIIGNEENPWRQPVAYSKENYLVPDNSYYVEEPYGEMFFPGATVGYSKVTVRNIQYENVISHSTGKVINEFYTAKDFPTITKQTPIDNHAVEPSILSGLFGVNVHMGVTAVKGYLVECNDMHGKVKAISNYSEPDPGDANAKETFISGVKYYYKTDDNNSSHLNNYAQVISNDRTISNATIGVDVDISSDAREEKFNSWNGGVSFNSELILVLFATLYIPIPLPSYSSENSYFRSMTTTKVVQRYGLLERTEAYEEGATITTKNEAYDAETGEVLLTRTQNEYEDQIYNATYPAHWVYDRMGPAYKNDMAVFKNVWYTAFMPDGGSPIILSSGLAKDYFVDGDEVLVTGIVLGTKKYWVARDYQNELGLIDKDGTNPPGTESYTLQITRSGRTNMAATPVMQATTLQYPVTSSKLTVSSGKQILDAKAEEYAEDWKQYCETQSTYKTTCSLSEKATELIGILSFLFTSGQLTVSDGNGTTKSISPTGSAYDTSFVNYKRDSCSNADNFKVVHTGEGVFGETLHYCDTSATTYIPYTDTGCIVGKTPQSIDSVWLVGSDIRGKINFGSGCYANLNITIEGLSQSELFINCVTVHSCPGIKPTIANPYLSATKGKWRKKKEWLYLDDRTTASAKTNIRKDGYYNTFDPFWDNPGDVWTANSNNNKNWIFKSEVTNYDPNGIEIENKDALGRYSSALFAYKTKSLPVAVANNAKRSQIGFEGFEENAYGNSAFSNSCPTAHWNFYQSDSLFMDSIAYHTGKYSLKLTTSKSAFNEYEVFNNTTDTTLCKNCILPFHPDSGQYVISAWVKTAAAMNDLSNRKAYMVITYAGTSQKDTLRPTGKIIEGWQRIASTLRILPAATSIKVTLKPDPGQTTWFDDLRVHPFNGNLKSYVYDPSTMRLIAELDENNYATFYEYDEQGALKRVKKETEEGIVTIKEIRSSTIKK